MNMNTGPMELVSMTVADGHVTIEFTTELPHHRHFTMGFRYGESAALDMALEDVATAAIAATQKAMMDILGDMSAPDDIAELQPPWQCRICDVVVPANTPGWVLISLDDSPPRAYCPSHA